MLKELVASWGSEGIYVHDSFLASGCHRNPWNFLACGHIAPVSASIFTWALFSVALLKTWFAGLRTHPGVQMISRWDTFFLYNFQTTVLFLLVIQMALILRHLINLFILNFQTTFSQRVCCQNTGVEKTTTKSKPKWERKRLASTLWLLDT